MPLIICFTSQNSEVLSANYPEGNFGGNQLLESSMSLSPLYPNLASDLYVSTATSLHRNFSRLRPVREKFTFFRVPLDALWLASLLPERGRGCNLEGFTTQRREQARRSLSLCVDGFYHHNARACSRLLGPCFKTGVMTPFKAAFVTKIHSTDRSAPWQSPRSPAVG